jgi:hypothetical protein
MMMMMTVSPKVDARLTAVFETRAAADRAVERLRAGGIPEAHIEIAEGVHSNASEAKSEGVLESVMSFLRPERSRDAVREGRASSGVLVTAHDVSQEHLEMASRLFKDAGAREIRQDGLDEPDRSNANPDVAAARAMPDEADHAPRRVQPGFADASPGVVPDAAEFSSALAGDDADGAGDLAEAKGRFASQLDHAGEGERASGSQDGPSEQGSVPSPGTEQANPERVAPGTPGAGENICRECGGSGRKDDKQCPACGGSGVVTTPIGGG